MAHYKNNIPVLFDIYDEAEHIHEDRTVFDGCIDMGGLPDSYLGVNVTCSGQHFHEIYENRTPGSLEFRIDYKHGWLYVNPTIYNGQKITLDYYSRGIELTPASRIYTFDANGCVDLEKTLQTYIDEVTGGCKFTEASVPSSVDAFENIKSGESFSTMFGKIARWFIELKAHLKGTKWRHKAEHVDCKDNKTVQAKIDALEQTDETLQANINKKAPINHASSATTYGVGNGISYGHVKLEDSINTNSGENGGYAATPSAVKQVNDKLNEKADKVTAGGFVAGGASIQNLGTDGRNIVIGNSASVDTCGSLLQEQPSKDTIIIGTRAIGRDGGVAIGYEANGGEHSVAVGENALNYAADSIAIGWGAQTLRHDTAIAIGCDAVSDGDGTVQIGAGNNKNDYTLQFRDYETIGYDESNDENYLKDVGKLSDLKTSDKSNIVAAINEIQDKKAPTSHASPDTKYGMGDSNNYGHVKLSDATDRTSGTGAGVAATPTAVKAVNDKIGDLTSLSTSAKNNVVAAINEVKSKAEDVDIKGTLKNPISTSNIDDVYESGWYMYQEYYANNQYSTLVQVVQDEYVYDLDVAMEDRRRVIQIRYDDAGPSLVRSTDYAESYEEAVKNGFGNWKSILEQYTGKLTDLKTSNKSNLVGAINEVDTAILNRSQIRIYTNISLDDGSVVYMPPPTSSGSVDSDGNGGYVWHAGLINERFNYPLFVSDPIFGEFSLGIPPHEDGKVGYGWDGTINNSKLEPDTDIMLYLKCNVQHDIQNNTITPTDWETVTVHSGCGVDYVEMKNGNTINAIYVYCGRLRFILSYNLSGVILPSKAEIIDCNDKLWGYGNRSYMTSDSNNSSYSTATLAEEILQMNYPGFNEETGEYEVEFKIPAITVDDSVFGEFSLPAQEGVEFSGQAPNDGYNDPLQEYYYARYSINNVFDKGKFHLNCNDVVGVIKTTGQPVSYIELKDGNTLSAIYIYLGYGEWSGDQPGPMGEKGLYRGNCDWNLNTQIPLLHFSLANESSSAASEIESLKAEIQELKANFIKNGDSVVIDASDSD